MLCASCGRENRPNAFFCNTCGARLDVFGKEALALSPDPAIAGEVGAGRDPPLPGQDHVPGSHAGGLFVGRQR